MSKKTEHDQVIKDEKTAERAYQSHLKQASILAKQMAEDDARTETQRVAAAEVAAALHKVEEARLRAEREQQPEAVKESFWKWLTG